MPPRNPWQPIPGVAPAGPAVLAEILDGGQAFRWRVEPDGGWAGVFGKTRARVRSGDSGRLEFFQEKGAPDLAPALAAYFGDAAKQAEALDRLPWRSDPVLRRAMEAFPGLRLLRQPFADALIGFICSANANIPRIRAMVESLARQFGEEIAPGVYATPAWEKLAAATEADLAPCRLGYRAAFLQNTARRLADDPEFESRLRTLPRDEARDALMSLPGVGPKVADCVRLFGLGHDDAFPVDTWIRRVLAERYGLDGWSDAQAVHFAKVHYGDGAGIAQQFLFAHARAEAAR